MIRVMIADGRTVMHDGVCHILEHAGDFKVACETSDSIQVTQLVCGHQPQVTILDLSAPGRSGFKLLCQLHNDHSRVRVLVLTMHAEEQYMTYAFRMGATGHLTKESAVIGLITVLQRAANSGTYASLPMTEKLAHSLDELSEETTHTRLPDREMEVYRRLVHGEPLIEIATSLCVSARTISTYKMRLMDKLQLSSETTLVRYAIRHRLFPDGDTLQLVPCWTRLGLATRQWPLPPNRYH